MQIRSLLDDVSQKICHIFLIAPLERIIFRVVFFMMPSYTLRKIRRYKVLFSAKFRSNTKLLLICQILEAYVVNGVRERHPFDAFAHCRPFLFAESQRCGGSILTQEVFFLPALEQLCRFFIPARTSSLFRFRVICKCTILSFSDVGSSYQVLFRPLPRPRKAPTELYSNIFMLAASSIS